MPTQLYGGAAGMLTTLVIGTVAYSSDGTAYAGFSGVTKSWADGNIFGLRLTGDDENYPSVEFSALGCGPAIPFAPGLPFQLVISHSDGSSPVVQFTGDVQRPQERASSHGPCWGYACTDLKWRGDRVALLSSSGLPVASYNLSPTDPYYLFSQAGKTVGQIVTDILQGAANAASLSGVGVGNYTVVSGVYTLPSQTATDLSALSVVPREPVQLSGECFFGILEGFVRRYHPQYTTSVRPDGTIRFVSIFGRPSHTFTQPSASSAGDPIDDLAYGVDLEGCYAAVQVIGQDIAWATLSYRDGTLVHASAAPSSPPWTLNDFKTPGNANDRGTASSVTSVSCTVHSDQGSVNWATNYWNTNGGVIVLYYLAGAGISITETRQVTACTAMSPGGTATISWDSSLPLDSTSYTRYKLYANNNPRGMWDREFFVAEPTGSLTGLATWVGSHMVPVSPYTFAWGNLGKGATQLTSIDVPSAKVLWSATGAWPWNEESVSCTVDPTRGSVVLNQPAVAYSAAMAGQGSALYNGYPTTYFQGLWYDVEVALPYNRGTINTRYPASAYAGTANSKYGVTRVKTIPLASFVWKGDAAALNQLAAEHLAVVQDAVIEGSFLVHFDAYAWFFDPLTIGYAVRVATPGGASEIDGIDLPVRSFVLEWPDDGADVHRITFHFSNKRRPFEADELYIHPQFAPTGWGTQGDILAAGDVGSGHASHTGWNDVSLGEGADKGWGDGGGMIDQSAGWGDNSGMGEQGMTADDIGPLGQSSSGMTSRGEKKAFRDAGRREGGKDAAKKKADLKLTRDVMKRLDAMNPEADTPPGDD